MKNPLQGVIPGDRRAVRMPGKRPKMPHEPTGPAEAAYPVARGVLKHGSVEVTISCERCRPSRSGLAGPASARH